jgi:predicted  nucleic acid-binding Zn-ribbon protein
MSAVVDDLEHELTHANNDVDTLQAEIQDLLKELEKYKNFSI